MLFDLSPADHPIGDGLILDEAPARWGVDSEYGRLRDVLVSPPPHLEIVPSNSVSIDNLRKGLACCAETAERQHSALVAALEGAGVRCHAVPPEQDLADLSFTRDATLMTPWGLLGLRPALDHREEEVTHVLATAQVWGLPALGSVDEGRIEGGDVCILRPGIVVVGWSGERTDLAGATALARLFEREGWQAILTRFDPHFLHLDTLFTVVDRNRAAACIEALEPAFVARMEALGLDLLRVGVDEVARLGANLVGLGGGRVLSSADNPRVNRELAKLGYEMVAVNIDQFTRCGGGVHCLTMPLSRMPG